MLGARTVTGCTCGGGNDHAVDCGLTLRVFKAPSAGRTEAAGRIYADALAGMLAGVLAVSTDPTDAQLLAAIERWRAGDLA